MWVCFVLNRRLKIRNSLLDQFLGEFVMKIPLIELIMIFGIWEMSCLHC